VIDRLVIKNLSKNYGKRETVRNISFTLSRGEIVGLLGPNGAGKSTTFHMLAGFSPVSAGTIHLNDTSLTTHNPAQRAKMGLSYLPQEPSIFRKMTVLDNLKAAIEVQPNLNLTQQKQLLDELIAKFSLIKLLATLGYQLSGGERRRVELARTLVTKPKFLLLDEPFAGVDLLMIHELKMLLILLKEENIGVLITDHNAKEILSCAQKVLILYQGQLIAEGPSDSITSQPHAALYFGHNFI
jgi:lipopolysaccharide export system ATP-binding protein